VVGRDRVHGVGAVRGQRRRGVGPARRDGGGLEVAGLGRAAGEARAVVVLAGRILDRHLHARDTRGGIRGGAGPGGRVGGRASRGVVRAGDREGRRRGRVDRVVLEREGGGA